MTDLPASAASISALDDRRLLAGAVERLLDRDDVRVGRRLLEEGDHHLEALIRVVDDDVLVADRREAIAAMFADALGKARVERRELEVGPVLLDQLRQIGDAEEAARFGDERVCGVRALRLTTATRLVGHLRLELQPDDPAAPAALDRGAEVADEILGLLLDLDVAVADDAEGAAAEHLIAGKQLIGLAADQRLDRDVARRLAGQADEARQRRRAPSSARGSLVVGPA